MRHKKKKEKVKRLVLKSWGDDIDDARKRNDANVPGALSAKTLGGVRGGSEEP